MSTVPTPAVPTKSPDEVEIRIISHSNLFYWWPVWAVGFLLFILSMFGDRMAIVPPPGEKGTEVLPQATVSATKDGKTTTLDNRTVIVLPKDYKAPDPPEKLIKLHMSANKAYGVIFMVTLLLVIVITNVPLRGMWSVLVIMTLVMLVIILSLIEGAWDLVLGWFFLLQIHINAAGYFFISSILFAIWLVTLLLFDKQVYMIFTPGQLKVCLEIGGGETAYDTTGMTIQKQRSDLFRHWILGLGSGDLVVNTAGAQAHHFDLPNVLFVGRKVAQIEDMMKEKAVVRGRP